MLETRMPKITVRRDFSATAGELFDAWLDPRAMAIWMRPGGVPRSSVKTDARIGGGFEIVMHAASGDLRHSGVYRAIDRPRRLVFTWISPATHQGETLVTVDFHARPDGTVIVVTHERLPDEAALASHTAGWTDALALLARRLAVPPEG